MHLSLSTFCDLRLAILELFLPIPIHFSRWGANLDAAKFLLQFGHTHSSCFLAGRFPNTSTPRRSTIAAGSKKPLLHITENFWQLKCRVLKTVIYLFHKVLIIFNDIFPNVVEYFSNYLREGCTSSDCEICLTKNWFGLVQTFRILYLKL